MKVVSSIVVMLVLSAHAVADPDTLAERAFQRGRSLMKALRYPEACAAFEQSQRLDPQLGTLFNLANCEVEIGKLASAWKIYRELAKSDPSAERKVMSRELAAQLEPRLPRLRLAVPMAPARLVVTIDQLDSTTLIGAEIPVDVGEHTVITIAPGFQKRSDTVAVKEAKVTELTLTLTPLNTREVSPEVAGINDTPKPSDTSSNPRRRYGLTAMIGGGTVVAAGLVIGTAAVLDWHDAQRVTGSDRTSKSHRAVVLGDVSTTVVIAGLIPMAAGVYLWRTAGSEAVVTPNVSAAHASVSITGRF